ncbi:GNAT family N-acetyltransferase, partial [Chitinimonas sp.]|uniref:GNAT family N-acetyltransferase n=1 Tax=Chitinimonas sp. TaxID=1934313 RepID=UPI0035B2CDFA
MNSDLTIRPVRAGDEAALAPLLVQLGYAIVAAELAERIALFADRATDCTLVAECDGVIVGCIGLHVMDCFHQVLRQGRVASLVVDERCRGRRIGAALLAAGEDWLRARGCARVELTSHGERRDAARGYQTQGDSHHSLRVVKPRP